MKSSPSHHADGLRARIPSLLPLPALSAGIVSGFGLLVAQVAFATFIFSGALAPYSSQGIGLVLFGNFASCLIIALASGYRGVVAGLSPVLVLVMATIAATIKTDSDALFATTVCTLIISAVTTGICCLLVGRFRLANLLRFIPYPVTGGFVAGIGGAVCVAAMSIMAAKADSRTAALTDATVMWTWLPGLAYGVVLYSAMKRWRNPIILPVSVLLLIAAYHLALSTLGISGGEAKASGLLLVSTAQGSLWPAFWPTDLAHVDWYAVVAQIPNILTLILIALICVIMNIAGLEVAVDEDLDWDHEFRTTGIASIVAGVGGATVSTVIVPASVRSKLSRATTRITGVIAACVIGVALLFGDGMLEMVPTALVGGILIFAGLGILDEGLLRSRKRLPGSEYSIILLIFFVIIFFGLTEGVAIGAVATLVFFAVRLSRVSPIAAHFTARERRSNKARSVPDRAILMAEGNNVQAYRLQGYIFFGSVGVLTSHLRKSLDAPSPPSCLMIDFTDVSGFDFSALNVVTRFVQRANTDGIRVILSGLSEKLRFGLERNIAPSVFAELYLEPDADLGMERCEEFLIAAWKDDAAMMEKRRTLLLEHTIDDLERHLERQAHFEELTEALRPWLVPRSYAPEELLAGPDIPREGVQLLLSGRASVYDSTGLRLRQCGPGDTIWPTDPEAEKKTTVIADESCHMMLLTHSTRNWLEEHKQGLTIKLYRYMLAEHIGTEPDNISEQETDGREENS